MFSLTLESKGEGRGRDDPQLSLCRVLQLSSGVSVQPERLLRFSARVIEGHLRDVLEPGARRRRTHTFES